VNVREGPGPAYQVVGRLDGGGSLPIVGRSADGVWWQVQLDGRLGWVARQVVLATGDAEAAPVAPAPPVPPPVSPAPVLTPQTGAP
jgi:uncharacterized protein YraI